MPLQIIIYKCDKIKENNSIHNYFKSKLFCLNHTLLENYKYVIGSPIQ